MTSNCLNVKNTFKVSEKLVLKSVNPFLWNNKWKIKIACKNLELASFNFCFVFEPYRSLQINSQHNVLNIRAFFFINRSHFWSLEAWEFYLKNIIKYKISSVDFIEYWTRILLHVNQKQSYFDDSKKSVYHTILKTHLWKEGLYTTNLRRYFVDFNLNILN